MIHDDIAKVNAVLMAGWTGAAASIDIGIKRKSELLYTYTESFITDSIAYLQHQDAGETLLERVLLDFIPEVFYMELGDSGVWGGLWELGRRLEAGLEIDLKKIPICQFTIELGEFFDQNPYYFDSRGSSLLVCADGEHMCEILIQNNIQAVVIGRTTTGKARRLHNGKEIRFLTPN